MNGALFIHTWRAYRLRLLIVTLAIFLWGTILPVIYDSFGAQFQSMLDSGLIPPQFAQFGGGDIFSLTGSVALGFVHPISDTVFGNPPVWTNASGRSPGDLTAALFVNACPAPTE